MSNKKDADGKFIVNKGIHNKLKKLVDTYTESHSKIHATRFDLTYPEGHQPRPGNEDISLTMAKVCQKFNRKNTELDPAYGWVREKKSSPNPHFHGMMLLNGQETRSAGMVFDYVEKCWQDTIGSDKKGLIDYCYGSIDDPHENGKVYQRKDGVPDYVEDQIRYMSKPDDKGEPKDGIRDVGTSRLGKYKKNNNLI